MISWEHFWIFASVSWLLWLSGSVIAMTKNGSKTLSCSLIWTSFQKPLTGIPVNCSVTKQLFLISFRLVYFRTSRGILVENKYMREVCLWMDIWKL